MSGVEETVAGGVAGPIIQPFVTWVVKRVNRRQQVARRAPGLVLNYITYNCIHVDEWVAEADEILRSDGWLKQEFWDREVHLRRIGSALVAHGYWRQSDAWHFERMSIEVLGPESTRKRLAIVLWAAREGILRKPGTAATDSSTAAGSRAQQAHGAIDARPQVHLDGNSDSAEAWRARTEQFSAPSPEAGIPISVNKIILGIIVDIRTTQTPTLMISERVFRDLGTLMHDRRGAYEIEVQCSLSHTLGNLVEDVNTKVLDGDRGFEVALLDNVETAVHGRICFAADRHYKRPVRPSDWPYGRELGSCFLLENQFWFHERRDGHVLRFWDPRKELGKVLVNDNAKIPSEVRRVVEAHKLLGCPVQHEELEFGLVRVALPSNDRVILGNVDLVDARRCLDKLTSIDSSGRKNEGDRWLDLLGWHKGPYVDERGEDWVIRIYDEDVPIPELVGYAVLGALPLNLC